MTQTQKEESMTGQAVKWLGLLGSAVILLVALGVGTRVTAQQYFGIIVGSVTDQSGILHG